MCWRSPAHTPLRRCHWGVSTQRRTPRARTTLRIAAHPRARRARQTAAPGDPCRGPGSCVNLPPPAIPAAGPPALAPQAPDDPCRGPGSCVNLPPPAIPAAGPPALAPQAPGDPCRGPGARVNLLPPAIPAAGPPALGTAGPRRSLPWARLVRQTAAPSDPCRGPSRTGNRRAPGDPCRGPGARVKLPPPAIPAAGPPALAPQAPGDPCRGPGARVNLPPEAMPPALAPQAPGVPSPPPSAERPPHRHAPPVCVHIQTRATLCRLDMPFPCMLWGAAAHMLPAPTIGSKRDDVDSWRRASRGCSCWAAVEDDSGGCVEAQDEGVRQHSGRTNQGAQAAQCQDHGPLCTTRCQAPGKGL